MREDYGNISLAPADDGFGDMGFDTDHPDMLRNAEDLDSHVDQANLLFSDGPSLDPTLDKDKEPIPSTSGEHNLSSITMQEPTPMEIDQPMHDNGFGDDQLGKFNLSYADKITSKSEK